MSPRQEFLHEARLPAKIFRGRLAEEYDGVGQYVLVSLARSSTAAAYKARVATGDFGGGRKFPVGTLVTVISHRGQLEVLLGNQPRICPCDEFNRVEGIGWGTGPLGTWQVPTGNDAEFTVDGEYGVISTPASDNQYTLLPDSPQLSVSLPFEAIMEVEARGHDPFVGWSAVATSGRSDFTWEVQLDSDFFVTFSIAGMSLFGTYPNAVLGLFRSEGRTGIGEADFDDVVPFNWPADQQDVGPIMMRFYVDDHGIYERVWLKSDPEPLVMQGEGDPQPWNILGNVLKPYYSTPTVDRAAEQAIWLAGGWGKGQPWSAYATRLGGFTNPDPFTAMMVGSAGLGNADAFLQRICVLSSKCKFK